MLREQRHAWFTKGTVFLSIENRGRLSRRWVGVGAYGAGRVSAGEGEALNGVKFTPW